MSNSDELKRRAHNAMVELVTIQNKKMPWIADKMGTSVSRVKSIRYDTGFSVSLDDTASISPVLNHPPHDLCHQLTA